MRRPLLGSPPRARFLGVLLLSILALTAGTDPSARAGLAAGPGSPPAAAGPALLEVHATTPEEVAALAARFDLAESRRGDRYDVIAWPGDRARLEAMGLPVRTRVADLARDGWPGQTPPTAGGKALPGELPYRHLADYEAELAALAATYPGHVRLLAGAEPTLEGRTVYGVEIAGDVARADGRPVAYIDGIHHAREWPAAEIPMNFAAQLAESYGVNPVVTELLDRLRVIVVPVVNPDGFNHSRESLYGEASELAFGIAAGGQGTYWRKNRHGLAHAPGISIGSWGVDNNRNYGWHWGTAAVVSSEASVFPFDQTYAGTEPFSEPETRNVQRWVLGNNVVAAITNHTAAGMVLWPWGHTWAEAPDRGMIALGEEMADITDYWGTPSIGLYPTHGIAQDWFYAATGAYAYTFEIGYGGFHPPEGPPHDKAVRRAYMEMLRWAADPEHHSVITGSVTDAHGMPLAAELRITKTFETPVSGQVPVFAPVIETIDRAMASGAGGTFEWHLGPSTRPVATEAEFYTLTVSAPGFAPRSLEAYVERGEAVDLGAIALDPA